MVATKPTVDVHIVSDTVCPWCYVGKARLSQAMAKFSGQLDFRVRWLPFQLNPGAPQEGVNKMQSYNDKFGPGRVAQMVPMMTRTFAEEGLPPYCMDGLTGSTLNSHRLLLWAAEAHGLAAQNALVDCLFQGYFTEAKYINDREFLLEAAAAAGLPAGEASKVLDDPQAYLKETQEELHRYPGVTGVPHFVVWAPGSSARPVARLGGAQPPEEFEEVFEAIAKQAQAAGAKASPAATAAPAGPAGAACGLGGGGDC